MCPRSVSYPPIENHSSQLFPFFVDEPGLLNGECSACDPQSNMQLRIDSVLRADNRKEWRSLSKAQDSMLQEINITINFPQVCYKGIREVNLSMPRAVMLANKNSNISCLQNIEKQTPQQERTANYVPLNGHN